VTDAPIREVEGLVGAMSIAGLAFFAAAGLDLSAHMVAQLNLLAVLQRLNMIGSSPRSRSATRASWAGRLQTVLDWR